MAGSESSSKTALLIAPIEWSKMKKPKRFSKIIVLRLTVNQQKEEKFQNITYFDPKYNLFWSKILLDYVWKKSVLTIFFKFPMIHRQMTHLSYDCIYDEKCVGQILFEVWLGQVWKMWIWGDKCVWSFLYTRGVMGTLDRAKSSHMHIFSTSRTVRSKKKS